MSQSDKKGIDLPDSKKCFDELTKKEYGDDNLLADYILKTKEWYLNKIDPLKNGTCVQIFNRIKQFYENN